MIAKIGTGGGQGYVLEYRGEAIRKLSMESRMTICNMSIEAGARAGMIAPDEITYEFVKGRPHAPQGADWDAAVAAWDQLKTDDDAVFDAEVHIDGSALTPFVTWGTNPGQGAPLGDSVPDPADFADESERLAAEKALAYMGLEAGTPLRECRSTPFSSVRAPTGVSRIFVRLQRFSRGARSQTVSGCSSCRARCGCALRPRTRVSVRSSPRRVPSGVRPDARCAWV